MKSNLEDAFPRSSDHAVKAYKALCRGYNTPKSLSWLKTLKEDHAIFVKTLTIDPKDYLTAADFRVDYLLCKFLSKYKGLKTGIDTRSVAFANFRIGEERCKSTNRRLRHRKPCIVDPVFHEAQRLVASVLGKFDIEKLAHAERWGPGATHELSRRQAYLDSKIGKLPISVTAECLPAFRAAITADLHWSAVILGSIPEGRFSLLDNVFQIVPGNRIDTVLKDAKTDRCIAIEPRGNMFMQKAAGSFIRRRLKRFGINLDDQSRNQLLARLGYEMGYATIDLSMASDTMSWRFVLELLPIEWFVYLDSLRSKSYVLDGSVPTLYEKFSSMGNGFTFELESLLFWALAKASCKESDAVVGVYGDDIIVPCADAHVTIAALAYAGFETNVDKTFVDGPFRESCGRHFFLGEEVTPIYQKEVVVDCLSHIRFLNRMLRYAAKYNDGDKLEPVSSRTWLKFYESSFYRQMPRIPLGSEGDDGYVVPHSLAYMDSRPICKTRGNRWNVIGSKIESIPADDGALYSYSLRLNHDKTGDRDRTFSMFYPEPLGSLTGLRDSPMSKALPYSVVESRSEMAVVLTKGTRWIIPAWEFCLDLV